MARPRTISDEQILETACRCFLEHGPSVPTETIAQQLGVSAQALLKRFQSKQDLLLAAVLPPAEAPWAALVEAGPDDRPLRVQLTEIIHELAGFYVDISRRMAVLRFSGIDPQELRKRYTEPPPLRNLRIVSAWFERAAGQALIRPTDYEVAALMILSAMHGPAMVAGLLGEQPTGHTRDEYVAAVVELIVGGLENSASAADSTLLTNRWPTRNPELFDTSELTPLERTT